MQLTEHGQTCSPLDDDEISVNSDEFGPGFDDVELVPAPQLGRDEIFIMKLRSIPYLKERISLWRFVLEYDEKIDGIKSDAELLRRTSKICCEHPVVLAIIGFTLAHANWMNAGKRGRERLDGYAIDGKRMLISSSVKIFLRSIISRLSSPLQAIFLFNGIFLLDFAIYFFQFDN